MPLAMNKSNSFFRNYRLTVCSLLFICCEIYVYLRRLYMYSFLYCSHSGQARRDEEMKAIKSSSERNTYVSNRPRNNERQCWPHQNWDSERRGWWNIGCNFTRRVKSSTSVLPWDEFIYRLKCVLSTNLPRLERLNLAYISFSKQWYVTM